jgi:sec-independent protein translocase protein TatA
LASWHRAQWCSTGSRATNQRFEILQCSSRAPLPIRGGAIGWTAALRDQPKNGSADWIVHARLYERSTSQRPRLSPMLNFDHHAARRLAVRETNMGIFSDLFRSPILIVVLVLVILLFGAPKLPALARSLGQSMKIFRREIKTRDDEPDDEAVAELEDDSTTTAAPKRAQPKPKK